MSEPQFVQVRFGGSRLYTYQNDGEHVVAGDLVEVDSPREGPVRLRVVTAWIGNPPNFACKPCKKVKPEPPADQQAEGVL